MHTALVFLDGAVATGARLRIQLNPLLIIVFTADLVLPLIKKLAIDWGMSFFIALKTKSSFTLVAIHIS